MSASACQSNTLDHLAGEENLQEQAEEIVAESPESRFNTEESCHSLLGPSHLALQFIEGQGRGTQKPRRGAARHIVTDEGEDIDEDGETEDDSCSS